MAIVFDGKLEARLREESLAKDVFELRQKDIKLKIASLLIGENKASALYTSLKKSAADRVGIDFQIYDFESTVALEELIATIQKLNMDPTIHGIMIQLPLPSNLSPSTNQLIEQIAPEKDVDGLREESSFTPATVKAVLNVVAFLDPKKDMHIVIVGSKGEVGRRLKNHMEKLGYKVEGVDKEVQDLQTKTKEADIIVSATGTPDLITAEIIKEGAAIVDVGAPKGDVNFYSVYNKASFITPVPGGIGPLTVVSLLESVYLAATKKASN